MSVLLEKVEREKGRRGFWVQCPGCGFRHLLYTDGADRPNWTFDGNMDAPTFSPSLLVRLKYNDGRPELVCHSFIRAGKWEFLNDCTHALAGQTVPMIPLDD